MKKSFFSKSFLSGGFFSSCPGWVAHSGHELSVHSRPWGGPLEFERDRRRFDDAEYPDADHFSAQVVGGGDCTTVVAYEGGELWRVR